MQFYFFWGACGSYTGGFFSDFSILLSRFCFREPSNSAGLTNLSQEIAELNEVAGEAKYSVLGPASVLSEAEGVTAELPGTQALEGPGSELLFSKISLSVTELHKKSASEKIDLSKRKIPECLKPLVVDCCSYT